MRERGGGREKKIALINQSMLSIRQASKKGTHCLNKTLIEPEKLFVMMIQKCLICAASVSL